MRSGASYEHDYELRDKRWLDGRAGTPVLMLRSRRGRLGRKLIHAVVFAPVTYSLLSLLGLWWLVAAVHITSTDILPAPALVAERAVELTHSPYGSETLFGHALTSIVRVTAGFASGCVAGIAVGILMRYVYAIRYFADPILAFLRPVPAFAFVTVLITWFGLGELPKVMLIFLAVFSLTTVFTAAAMEALPPQMQDAARTLGATGWRLFWFVQVPAALPDVLVGMRLTLALAWTAVMGAELVAADSGLGWMVWNAVRFGQTEVVFVAVVGIAVIGALMDLLLVLLTQALTGNWRTHMRSS